MRILAWLLCCVALLSGCGSDQGFVLVKGRVLLDGKPVENAAVLFEPELGGVPATGVTNSNGEFSLSTAGQGVGAAIGKHGVSVSKQVVAQPNRKVEEGEIVPMKYETPEKYASPRTSGTSFEVKAGMAAVELQLTSGR